MRVQELPVPESDADEVRRRAADILADGDFGPPRPSIIDRIGERVAEWFGDLFEILAGSGGSSLVAWLILAVFVGALVVLLTRALRRGWSIRPAPTREPTVAYTRHEPPSAWRDQAEAYEAEGRWDEAVRARYRVIVAELVERGVLGDSVGRTTGEFRADVASAAPGLDVDFGTASTIFEDVWYGDHEATADDCRRLTDLARSMTVGSDA